LLNTETEATLMIASAMITSASSAVIILTRSGVRPGSRARSPCQRRSLDVVVMRSQLGGRQPQHVPDPAQRVDEAGLGGVDFAAQHGHVGLHDPGVSPEVVVPHVVENLHLG